MRRRSNSFFSKLKYFWSKIVDLPFGRRLVFFASIFGIVFLFFPWFSEGKIWSLSSSAFGKFSIFGIFLFSFFIFSFLLILREVFSEKGFLGTFPHGKIFIFLFAQGLYTVVLANFTLYGLLPDNSNYEVGIGVMLTFVAFGVGLVGALFSKDFLPKGEQKKVIMDTQNIDVSTIKMQPEKDLSLEKYDEQ
jgi:hypothetical protein